MFNDVPPPPTITRSFCTKPASDDVVYKEIPGCISNWEYNPEGNGWCGYYAVCFAFLFPSDAVFADLSGPSVRKVLSLHLPDMKPSLEKLGFMDVEELEGTLTREIKEDAEDWWCSLDVILFCAFLCEVSFLYKDGEELEEDGSVILPTLFSVKGKPPRYFIYLESNVHYRVYELEYLPPSFVPRTCAFQSEIDSMFADDI